MIGVFNIQKHEELSSTCNNGPVSIADVENETVVKLVDAGVSAMLTRLQSKIHVEHVHCMTFVKCVYMNRLF